MAKSKSKKKKPAATVSPEHQRLINYAEQLQSFDMREYLTSLLNSRATERMVAKTNREWEQEMFALLEDQCKPEAWSDRIPFKQTLFIKANSWRPKFLFPTPLYHGEVGDMVTVEKFRDFVVACPTGPKADRVFFYCNRVLPRGRSLKTIDPTGEINGHVFFDNDVATPVLFEMDSDGEQRVWMGLTPMEILTQRPGLYMAEGRVVVGGLGLGWFLDAVCQKPEVTEVVLVEKDEALMHWLRPAVEAAYPAIAAKCKTWIVSDVYDFMEKEKPEDRDRTRYLLDIWPAFGDCQDDERFQRWTKLLPSSHLWGWGEH